MRDRKKIDCSENRKTSSIAKPKMPRRLHFEALVWEHLLYQEEFGGVDMDDMTSIFASLLYLHRADRAVLRSCPPDPTTDEVFLYPGGGYPHVRFMFCSDNEHRSGDIVVLSIIVNEIEVINDA